MSETIQLDNEFRVSKSGGQYTLENLCEIKNHKTNETRKDWKPHGYHGSMKSCMKGYVRHSIDACSSVIDIIARLDAMDASIDATLKRVRGK